MRLKGYFVCVFLCTAIASQFLANHLTRFRTQAHSPRASHATNPNHANHAAVVPHSPTFCAATHDCPSPFSIPMALEANGGQADPRVRFIGRVSGAAISLTREGIEIEVEGGWKEKQGRIVKIRFDEISDGSLPAQNQVAHTSGKTSATGVVKPRSKGKSRRSASGGHRRARKKSSRTRTRGKRVAKHRTPGHRQVRRKKAPARASATRIEKFAGTRVDAVNLQWQGQDKVSGETNYFIGNDPAQWRTHVPRFSRASAKQALPGVDVVAYGNQRALEYDLRVGPEVDARNLRLRISGADVTQIDPLGNLVIQVAGRELRMQKPAMYEDLAGRHVPLAGEYELEPDGTLGFQIKREAGSARSDLAMHTDAGANAAGVPGTLVIDPTLSVDYATFLGGSGNDVATSVALDSSGKIYVSGTTTSAASFAEFPSSTKLGPGGNSDYFIAKIDPTKSGANSLIYLTFIGGSGSEGGGFLAVNANGSAAIAGVTTSSDFPVTDGSTRTAGSNDATVTVLSASGAQLIFSTLFGGSGAEATQGPGGIAMDGSGNIFVAMDTNSTDLKTTSGAFQTAYGGGVSDGFLAIFQPQSTPTLKYCTYLGLNAQASVTGIAVDGAGNAFLAGFTTDPGASMNTSNGFQTTYGGDPNDGFVMKLTPSGNGAADLSYASFLGGAGSDKALSIAVGSNLPATAYVTGATQSTNFPVNGSVAGLQSTLEGTANAFLSVIVQNALTGTTSLAYSSYLGGSETDSGQSVWFAGVNQIYVAGTSTSWDFPWQDNFQPFNGASVAFVTMLDPTSPGSASLLYSTPLGGTSPPGLTTGSQGNSVAADALGNVYIAGATATVDFPRSGTPGNGFQLVCASCQTSPPQNDAFVVEISPSAAMNGSVSFNAANLNFGSQPVGVPNNAQLAVAIINTGDAPLSVSLIGITGTNSSDFSAVNAYACFASAISPGSLCSFEMQFSPSVVGMEGAALSVTDNATGSPQVLTLLGTGAGPLAVPSPVSVNFGNTPAGTSSTSQQITLANTGNQTLEITNFNFSGNAAQFLLGENTCTAPNTVAAGASCIMQVSFAPSTTGTFNASLNVTDNSGNVSGAMQSIPLTGVGTAPAPILVISPGALGFAAQAVGGTSALQAATLTNRGSAALDISAIGISGTDAASFAIIQPAGNACPASGILAANASCTVSVTFSPASSGSKNAGLGISDNASGSPQTISLSGTGVTPSINLSPTTLNFGSQGAGTTSAAQIVTVSNPGNVALGIAAIALSGSNPGDFIQTNNCPPSLGVGSSCQVMVQFDPSAVGSASRTASVSISDNAPLSPQMVALTGTAVVAAVSLTPTTINFGNQVVGTPSSPASIAITDTGTGALSVSAVSATDSNDFKSTNNCTSVSAGGTCTVQVTFSPAAPASGAQCGSTDGTKESMLMVTDNAGNSPQTVTLNGAATDFCLGPPSVGGGSAAVSPGMTATYQLDLTSIGGFSGAVALSCAGAVPGGTCSTSASTVTVAANGQAPFQVTVTTPAEAVRADTRQRRWPPSDWYASPVMLFALLLIVTFYCGGTKRPGRRVEVRALHNLFSSKTFWALQALALIIAFVVSMSACGGGSGGGQQATTYSLTVTATADGATRNAVLTLIVQ